MSASQESQNETAGVSYAGSAYIFWGLVPLYWDRLSMVPPLELATHRLLWCALCAIAMTAAQGRLGKVLTIVREPRMFAALTVSSLLITANWTIYIWSVATHQLVEAALGYYINPLISIILGVTVLGERLSRFRLFALALAGIAVTVQTFEFGHTPWIALGLALSFGFYGFVRKQTAVSALDGLTIETGLLLPFTVAAVAFWAWQGSGAFPSPRLWIDGMLLAAGPISAVPLVFFAAGVRRMRLSTLGFLQYLSPSLTLLVATLVLGERFTTSDAITFGCVWAALALVGLEGRAQSVARSLARLRA